MIKKLQKNYLQLSYPYASFHFISEISDTYYHPSFVAHLHRVRNKDDDLRYRIRFPVEYKHNEK